MSDVPELEPVPQGPVGPAGEIRTGRYAGALDEVRWGYPEGWLRGQVKRALGRKRWFQAAVFTRDLIVVVRVVDQGLAGSGLVWVADPGTGRTLFEHRLPGIPLANLAVGPLAGRGTDAHVTLPHARIRLFREASASAWELSAHVPGHAISIGLDTRRAPIPVMFVGEPNPGDGVLMQRFVGLEVRGTVRLRSEVKSLEAPGQDAQGYLEYGNGFFPRPLMWSSALLVGAADSPWAFVSDLPVFGRDGESALWDAPMPEGPAVLGRPLPSLPRALGAAALSGSAESREPWRVTTAAGRVSLWFQPRAICTERFGAGPTSMHHALVAGRFEGTVETAAGPRAIDAPGLCEARAFD